MGNIMTFLHTTTLPHFHFVQEAAVGVVVLAAFAFLAWRLLRREPDSGCSSTCHAATKVVAPKLLRAESLVRNKRSASNQRYSTDR